MKVKYNKHWGDYGGIRTFKVDAILLKKIIKFLKLLCNMNNSLSLELYKRWVNTMFNINISNCWISNCFCNLMFYSIKKQNQVNHNLKWENKNMIRYANHLAWIKTVDLKKVKFMDESHFDGRGTKIRRGRGLRNTRINYTNYTNLNETISISLLLCIDHYDTPFFVSGRSNSNNQIDFLKFLLDCLENKYLQNGDYLVLDNAKIHTASDTLQFIEYLLQKFGVTLILLPTFSPELNPCENVFGWIKNKVYKYGIEENSIAENIENSLTELKYSTILSFYKKCCISIFNIQNQELFI